MEIVATYSDEARSGLRLEKPAPGMRRMLGRREARGKSGFDTILVYDITRWGAVFRTRTRAHPIEYACQESQGPSSLLHGAVRQTTAAPVGQHHQGRSKRSMAAEQSRELSNKVFRGPVPA